MVDDIKAIETRYRGYRFRSRLEARWAVFFDALGIRWEYEPEGFDLGGWGWYLPDFYLPEWGAWIEIKPALPTDEEYTKFTAFAHMRTRATSGGMKNSFMLCGSPGIPALSFGNNGTWELRDGYVSLSPVVLKRRVDLTPHTSRDVKFDMLRPTELGELGDEDSEIFCPVEAFAFTQGGRNLDIWPVYLTVVGGVDGGSVSALLDQRNVKHDAFLSPLYPSGLITRYYTGDGVRYDSMPLRVAYTAARSARFEHGEQPFGS